ncbi:MAG: Sec-independent protein translocase subunit TatA [Actinomycetota bacterium]|nr:Sec-independent protein translocase subunit TatA [Actinomycetota bacterium]
MFRSLGAPELLIILVLLVLLFGVFGAKRLPDASRSIGRSLRIFKSEVQEMRKDDSDTTVPSSRGDEIEGRIVEPGQAHRVSETHRREP